MLASESSARARAVELAAAVERGEWPPKASRVRVPGPEWLAPKTRVEASIRLAAVMALAGLAAAFAMLGRDEPDAALGFIVIGLVIVALVSCVSAVTVPARRRRGGRGFVFQVFSPKHLLESGAMLGVDRKVGALGLSLLAVVVLAAFLYGAATAR